MYDALITEPGAVATAFMVPYLFGSLNAVATAPGFCNARGLLKSVNIPAPLIFVLGWPVSVPGSRRWCRACPGWRESLAGLK